MSDDANDAAVLLDLLEIRVDGLAAEVVLPFLRRFRERLLLALVPAENRLQCPPSVACTLSLPPCNVPVSS